MKPKVYISVEGGCITGVLSTVPIRIEIWDWDNIKVEREDTKSLEEEWEAMREKLLAVY